MSGFSAEWLALREPADHRARSPALVAELRSVFAGRDTAAIIDLGCGTGSNLRALAASLPRRQSWRLVDRDPALLGAARERLAAWADASEAGAGLHLRKGGRRHRGVASSRPISRKASRRFSAMAGSIL